MKRTVKLIIIYLMFCISTNSSLGQEEFRDNIKLNGSSKTVNRLIIVSKEVKSLSLFVESKIEKGSVIIKIVDPNKKEKARLVIHSEDSPLSKIGPFFFIDTINVAEGLPKLTKPKNIDVAVTKINKTINLPLEGIWTISIEPKRAIGNVFIKNANN